MKNIYYMAPFARHCWHGNSNAQQLDKSKTPKWIGNRRAWWKICDKMQFSANSCFWRFMIPPVSSQRHKLQCFLPTKMEWREWTQESKLEKSKTTPIQHIPKSLCCFIFVWWGLMRFDEVCRFAVQGNDPCTFGSTRSPGAAAARVVWSPGFMLCYQRLGRCQDAWDLFWFWWILLVCLSLSFWERFGPWNHEWK